MNWSDFIGALIGGAFTMVAIYITIIFERRKEEENSRLQILPYLNYKYIEYDDEKKQTEDLWLNIEAKYHDNKLTIDQYTRGYLIIKNIGLQSAIEINVLQTNFDDVKNIHSLKEMDVIEVNNSGVIFITATPSSIKELKKNNISRMPIKILIGYSDLLDYYYEQTVELVLCITRQQIIDNSVNDNHKIISENYFFGCVINNVSRPIVNKKKHIKYEKFRRVDEFLEKNSSS